MLLISGTAEAFSFGWRIISRPTTKPLINLCFLDSLRGWVVGRQGTILKTVDGGLSWIHQNSGVNTDIANVTMLNSRRGWALTNVLFVDTTTWYGTKILKTTDGGDTWTNEQFPIVAKYFSSIVFLDSLNGWLGGVNGNLFRTTNGGASWVQANVDSSLFAYLSIARVKFFSPRFGFAVGGRFDFAGVVWRTTDAGEHWTAFGVSPEPVYDLHFIDSLNIIGVGGDVKFGASVLHSENGGQSWKYAYLEIFGLPATLSFRTSAEGWSPLGASGMFMYTLDTGKTWTGFNSPERVAVYDLMFVDTTTGYAVGDSGAVLKYDRTIVSAGEQTVLPSMARLDQNYPNPFNPATRIRFEIPYSSFVTLKVFDMLGREVRIMVNDRLEAGKYELTFEANELTSGVYFYRLQAGSYVQTKKLLLLK